MSRKINEQLLDMMGDVDERYIREYIDARAKSHSPRRTKMRLAALLAAAMAMLFGTASLAAATPAIGHFLADLANERHAVMQNFDEIEAEYAAVIGDTQECGGVVGTLNSAVVEDRHLLLSYTFNWGGLEEAKDGSFHTYFLPWFFYITEGDNVICQSEYTNGLHTQIYPGDVDDDFTGTYIYCIDLAGMDGQDLVGKELTVRLLYAEDGEGFASAFTPEACFMGRSWDIGRTYEFGEHRITLDSIQESALYVTLFMDCATIGHDGDEYAFILSDELGSAYTLYPYDDNEAEGCWFTKPEAMGAQLTLKVIRSSRESDPYGVTINDSYEILYEIPIELKTSFWDNLLGAF